MAKMTGAQMLVETLKREGVKHIFGYPGGAIIDVFDELYKQKDIEVILPRHEQAAAHAADGYARASGKVGVCMATSGPGATNLVTGIATAYMDSIPIVAITGQVPTTMVGSDAFQEVDATGVTRSITKHNYLVKSIDKLPRIIREAFYIASSGRRGPVHVDFPKDVQQDEAEYVYPEKITMRSYKPYENLSGHPLQRKKAIELINSSKRPIVYSGGGVISGGASQELREFVEKTGIPITSTLLGLGAFPADHPLWLGMLGMHGTVYANYAISESDLIIAIGARFDDRVTGKIEEFAPNAKIIHIDIDPTSISKNIIVDVPIVGDVKAVLRELNKKVKKVNISEWLSRIEEWKKEYPLAYENSDKVIKPQYLVEQVWELTRGDAIIVTDVGQHQMWVAQYYKFNKPRTLLTSGGLGTMGYGFPASIGAQVAKPKEKVILFTGDGSFQMNIQELATVATYDLPVKVIIMNNSYLGMVRQWQELFYERRYSSTWLGKGSNPYFPDFAKLADAYGIKSLRIDKPSEVKSAVKEMLEHKGPFILDVLIDQEENVFPMVPAGASLMQMLGGMA